MWVPKRPVPIKHDVGALITHEWITRTDLTGVILQKKKVRIQSLFYGARKMLSRSTKSVIWVSRRECHTQERISQLENISQMRWSCAL